MSGVNLDGRLPADNSVRRFSVVPSSPRPPVIHRLLHCAERAGGNTDHAAATAARVDRGQIAALVLDDGARLAHQPRLARRARLAGIGVDPEDGTHEAAVSATAALSAAEV